MKGFDIIVSRFTLYFKTLIIFILSILSVWYLIIHANLQIINIKLFQSLVLFLNDSSHFSNILEYIAVLLIKVVYNIDIHHLQDFFNHINPLIGG